MLDSQTTAQLRKYFELIREPVNLEFSGDDSADSQKMRTLLDEIAALSERITVREVAAERTPSFRVARANSEVGVTFAGIPLGHEFESLLLALLQVGGHPVKISPELAERVEALPELDFTTYFSLTCQNCPTVVQALNSMSVLNPKIRHTAVEGGLNREEVQRLGVMSVPTVMLNGEEFAQGRMGIERILDRLEDQGITASLSGASESADGVASGADAAIGAAGAAPRQSVAARRMTELGTLNVLVIGGGPAGSAAAIYTARKGLKTALVTGNIGGQVLETTGIENIPGIPHTEGSKLAANLEEHIRDYRVNVFQGVTAHSLERGADGLITAQFEGEARLQARSVILAVGAQWRLLGVPGESEYRNRGVSFCPHCDGPVFAGKPLAVVGGGNSGVEAAIDLAGVASHVTLFEFQDHLKADEVLVEKARDMGNIDIVTGAAVSEVLGDGARVTGLAWQDRESGDSNRVDVSGVFVQIGLVPGTAWLSGIVDLNARGEIIIDREGATSLEGVYAAGDCTDEPYKQITIAFGAGATASLGAFNYLIRSGSSPSN